MSLDYHSNYDFDLDCYSINYQAFKAWLTFIMHHVSYKVHILSGLFLYMSAYMIVVYWLICTIH